MHIVESGFDEDQESFIITTETACYSYHKEGGGFSSLVDSDGNDWINYHLGNEERGEYRGIPNMGLNCFGHPGYLFGASSTIQKLSDTHARILSTSSDTSWKVAWDIHPEFTTMTALSVGAPSWLLYEGTPGGIFDPRHQHWYSADGVKHDCTETFVGPTSIGKNKWVAFCAPSCNRSLLLWYHGIDDTVSDVYHPMGDTANGGMVVFGFSRFWDSESEQFKMYLTTTPFHLTLAFVESIDFLKIEEHFHFIKQQQQLINHN